MTMKFSEAIRLGSMDCPQAFYKLYDKDTGGRCALGAALHATGQSEAPDEWTVINNRVVMRGCPVCGRHAGIIHLNDTHRWTRQAIADYVELFEVNDEIQKPVTSLETKEPVPCF